MENLYDSYEGMKLVASMVLPNHTTAEPEMLPIYLMGGIPDTYEWFVIKTSFLNLNGDSMDANDLELFKEWQEYVINKANEFIAEHGIEVKEVSP